MNYSVATIRRVVAELREQYGVNTKTGLATAYLRQEFFKVQKQIEYLIEFITSELIFGLLFL